MSLLQLWESLRPYDDRLSRSLLGPVNLCYIVYFSLAFIVVGLYWLVSFILFYIFIYCCRVGGFFSLGRVLISFVGV